MLNSQGTSIQSSHLTDEQTGSQSKLQGFPETEEGLQVKLHYLFSTPPPISSLEPSHHQDALWLGTLKPSPLPQMKT